MMTTFRAFAPRLWAGFGTAALVAAVGLFASSRPAHTAGGPIPVNVANTVSVAATTPLPTTAADNPDKQPFGSYIEIKFSAGSQNGVANFNIQGSQTFQVPTGKRLIIDSASFYRENGGQGGSLPTGTSASALLGVTFNGKEIFYSLPLATSVGVPYPGATQSLHLFADPGTTVQANGYRNDTSAAEIDYVALSGHLVNVP